MRRAYLWRSFFFFLLLTGCKSGAEKFFGNFYNQASGDWKSDQITVLSSETNDLLPAKLRIKLTPCTASPCTVSISVDNEEYIDMQYSRGNGGSGSSESTKPTAMVLIFNRYTGAKDSLSEKEVFFVEKIQTFFIDKFSDSRLNASISFQEGIALSAIFVPE